MFLCTLFSERIEGKKERGRGGGGAGESGRRNLEFSFLKEGLVLKQ